MANYVVPQVLVFQEFNLVPATNIRPLPAFISGGHAHLVRYSDSDEKPNGLLGYYDALDDAAYSWPTRPAGALIDTSYTKLYLDNALLKYFADDLSEGSTITKVTGYKNRIRSNTVAFVANGEAYPRDDQFYDRDVKIGDVAYVRVADAGLWTYVNGFAGEAVAAVIDTLEYDDDNTVSRSALTQASKIGGADNCVDISASSAAAYNGLATGDEVETYTITVLESSVGGDATTARLRVDSASGNDDVASFAPSAFGVATPIGANGATATWNTGSGACEDEAESDGVADGDFIAGQKFRLKVYQAFSAPTAASSGSYTGPRDLTYIVTVSRGGLFAGGAKPQITVTTDRGEDVSGPTNVNASGVAVAVGTYGVNVAFTGTMLNAGDKYYIPVTAATTGSKQTLILGHDLPAEVADGEEVGLTLYIRKNIEIGMNRTGQAPLTNWEQSDTELTVKSGVTAYDSSWTDSGVPLALPVFSSEAAGYGKLYVEYRAWRSDLAFEVGTITDVADLNTLIPGSLTPDNPLKNGVFKALANANGQPVTFCAVVDPTDPDNWVDTLDLIDGRDDVYGMVPLTRDQTVIDLFAAHADSQSAPEYGRWRVLWVSLAGQPIKAVVTEALSSDLEPVLAKLEDDPNTSGTQYTLLTVPAGNGQFIANGVQPGDVVRYLYTTDGFGTESYSEFVVDAILSENTLRLVTGNGTAVNLAQKVEIWRNLTKTEQATEIGLKAGAYANRRVRAVWPDTISSGGTSMEGYHLCAALAGLCSGVVPHQGLTHLAISGFDDVSRTVDVFNRTQLNLMAGSGTWIVTQDLQSGEIFTRHAVTTAAYDDLNAREEMIVRNVDSISYQFQDRFAPYIGVANVTPTLIDIIRTETQALIQFLKSNYYTQTLGGQLIDATITDLRPSLLAADRIVLAVSMTVPKSLNNLEAHLVI